MCFSNNHQKDSKLTVYLTISQLTDKCKKALSRIFRICDFDNDGMLSDLELAQFQRRCFHMDLESGTLDSLKAVVLKNAKDGIQNGGLTLKGDIFMKYCFYS